MRLQHESPLNGFIIQEGAIPQALKRLLPPFLSLQSISQGSCNPIARYGRQTFSRWNRLLSRLRLSSAALRRTQVLLVMSHDSKSRRDDSHDCARKAHPERDIGSQGVMTLENDELCLKFPSSGSSDRVKAIQSILSEAVASIGGELVCFPGNRIFGRHEITVHPLG